MGSSPYHPTYTIPDTPHIPHPHYTHTPSSLHHPPHSTTIIPLPPHHRTPARTWGSCPLWDMLSLPGVLWRAGSHQNPWCPIEYRGCREEGMPGAHDWVDAGGWSTVCTVPCLLPLPLLEGGTPCTGHQPLTQRDLGWPGPGLCGGKGDSSPPRPNTKTNGIQPPMALAGPGFWLWDEGALSQLDVASWALAVPHRSGSLT